MNHFQLKQPYPDQLTDQFFVALLDFLLVLAIVDICKNISQTEVVV